MADEPNTNLEADAVRFLKWLRPGGPWVLSAKVADSGRFETATLSDLDAAGDWIAARNGRANLYVMINPARRRLSSKAKKEDVEELTFLHVDMDVKTGDLEAGLANIRAKLEAFAPRPSGVIFSGGGYWGFWRLAPGETLYLGGDEIRAAEAEAYNRGLERVLEADTCHNVDRICRLPGTMNLPDDGKRKRGREAVASSIVWLDERVHALRDFMPISVEKGQRKGGERNRIGTKGHGRPDIIKLGNPTELDRWSVPLWAQAVIIEGTDPTDPDRWGGDRSAAQWAVTCELARRGVPPGLIVGILTDKTWGIAAHVLDHKGHLDYAWKQVEKAYAEADDSWPMRSVDAAVDWINKRYFAALEGKRIAFYREQTDKLFPMDKEAFTFELAGKDIIVGSPSKEQRVPASQLWARDARKRYYPDGLILDPDRKDDGRVYNLWRGFGVEPRPGDWSLMQAHILNVLASGNSEHADYITRFAAWCFQNPATPPRVALVFQGGEGVGKGVFAQQLMDGFGHHGLHVRSMSQVTGRFNSHLRHCCLLYADEAEATNTREEGALKGLITERTIACEGKGKDLIQVENHVHLIMASNENWVVPAGKDSRRFAVFRVSSARQRDKTYFDALVAQMRSGGLQAMIHDMLEMDLSGFHPEHDRPETDALAEQRAASLRGFERVWFDVLHSGDMPPLYSSKRVGADSVFVATSEFRDFAMQKMRREDLTVSEVGGLFGRLGFEKVERGRPRGWIVPPLSEARAIWDAKSFQMAWDSTSSWAVEEQSDAADRPY